MVVLLTLHRPNGFLKIILELCRNLRLNLSSRNSLRLDYVTILFQLFYSDGKGYYCISVKDIEFILSLMLWVVNVVNRLENLKFSQLKLIFFRLDKTSMITNYLTTSCIPYLIYKEYIPYALLPYYLVMH